VPGSSRIERSCKPQLDRISRAPTQPGIERFDAFFTGHAYDPHRHDSYAIGYTLSGVQSFVYRGARANSVRGNVIVIHPDEVHDGRAGAEPGFRYRMIYLQPALVRDALQGRARSLPFVRNVLSRDQRLYEALLPSFSDMTRPLEELELAQVIAGIADALLEMDPSARVVAGVDKHYRQIARARDYLDAYFQQTVTSAQLERVTGLDRYSMARAFRRHFGTSPYRYLTMRRLDQVRAALRTRTSLADAAFASGFADQAHMTRQFKRAFGLSPGRWRQLCWNCTDLKPATACARQLD
jgi:AraC-like DNA-binding protein